MPPWERFCGWPTVPRSGLSRRREPPHPKRGLRWVCADGDGAPCDERNSPRPEAAVRRNVSCRLAQCHLHVVSDIHQELGRADACILLIGLLRSVELGCSDDLNDPEGGPGAALPMTTPNCGQTLAPDRTGTPRGDGRGCGQGTPAPSKRSRASDDYSMRRCGDLGASCGSHLQSLPQPTQPTCFGRDRMLFVRFPSNFSGPFYAAWSGRGHEQTEPVSVRNRVRCAARVRRAERLPLFATTVTRVPAAASFEADSANMPSPETIATSSNLDASDSSATPKSARSAPLRPRPSTSRRPPRQPRPAATSEAGPHPRTT